MEWDGINPAKYVGLSNYNQIFTDSSFRQSIINTIIWVISSLLFPVAIGLLLAIILQRIRGGIVYKNMIYLPHAISATATGVVFAALLANDGISTLFESIGWDYFAVNWLHTPILNTAAMIGTYTWQNIGTNMVLFLVGLQAIPKDPLEAGLIDGANRWKMFWHITFPLLKPITSVVVLMAVVNSFKVFDTIWVMTQGGPYRSSETLAITMYRESFVLSHYGYGSSVAVVLSIFVIALSWLYLKSTITDGES